MYPEFSDRRFLEDHICRILAFYEPSVVDPAGGFFQNFRDDGSVFDARRRHLVSSTRFVFNYAMAGRYFGRADYLDRAQSGLDFLERRHRQASGGYAWLLDGETVVDATNHCYGLAFVMIAGATALLAGLERGRASLDAAWQLLERHFWDAAQGLYKDEASSDFAVISPYRGQNANMHACEALIWAYEATADARFLERAAEIADNITRRQAALAGGLVWEHYHADWSVDWDYNRDDPKHLFRPWGFQAGHQTEWAKLLLILSRHAPEVWHLPTARGLFDRAVEAAWDAEYGGLCYGFDPQGRICDGDKYFWVQVESLAAAKLLELASGERRYGEWYQRLWQYSWDHMIDHEYGAWYRILTRDNQKYDDHKSPLGKTDYHTMGACYEVLRATAPFRAPTPGNSM